MGGKRESSQKDPTTTKGHDAACAPSPLTNRATLSQYNQEDRYEADRYNYNRDYDWNEPLPIVCHPIPS